MTNSETDSIIFNTPYSQYVSPQMDYFTYNKLHFLLKSVIQDKLPHQIYLRSFFFTLKVNKKTKD